MRYHMMRWCVFYALLYLFVESHAIFLFRERSAPSGVVK